MTPTVKLRFFEKTIHFNSGSTVDDGIPIIGVQKFKVLQQWWEWPNSFDVITAQPVGEWRDVPLEQEQP